MMPSRIPVAVDVPIELSAICRCSVGIGAPVRSEWLDKVEVTNGVSIERGMQICVGPQQVEIFGSYGAAHQFRIYLHLVRYHDEQQLSADLSGERAKLRNVLPMQRPGFLASFSQVLGKKEEVERERGRRYCPL